MSTLFIGGSRAIARIPGSALGRLQNIVAKQYAVVVADAAGADLAVQDFFHAERYGLVEVYCSGDRPRHNVGNWRVQPVPAPALTGFQFFAEKDKAMAQAADFGARH